MQILHEQSRSSSIVDAYEKITSSETRSAFMYMIVNSGRLKDINTTSSSEGNKKHIDFRKGNTIYFAFITNSEWLLFYFRKPLFNNESVTRNDIYLNFPLAELNPTDEITLKIHSLDDVKRVFEFISTL